MVVTQDVSHKDEMTFMHEHHPPEVPGDVVSIFVQNIKVLTFGL